MYVHFTPLLGRQVTNTHTNTRLKFEEVRHIRTDKLR